MNGIRRQSGFTILSALFLLVVLAALGAYMVRLSTAQHLSTALTVNASRAYYAAYSGMEWAAFRIRSLTACPTVPTSFAVEGYTVSLTACSKETVTEGAANYGVYDVSVQATRGSFGDSDYVRRRLTALLTD
jgi:MSHA biogenesis protein MshP